MSESESAALRASDAAPESASVARWGSAGHCFTLTENVWLHPVAECPDRDEHDEPCCGYGPPPTEFAS